MRIRIFSVAFLLGLSGVVGFDLAATEPIQGPMTGGGETTGTFEGLFETERHGIPAMGWVITGLLILFFPLWARLIPVVSTMLDLVPWQVEVTVALIGFQFILYAFSPPALGGLWFLTFIGTSGWFFARYMLSFLYKMTS